VVHCTGPGQLQGGWLQRSESLHRSKVQKLKAASITSIGSSSTCGALDCRRGKKCIGKEHALSV
jgi:hypothetical protein